MILIIEFLRNVFLLLFLIIAIMMGIMLLCCIVSMISEDIIKPAIRSARTPKKTE